MEIALRSTIKINVLKDSLADYKIQLPLAKRKLGRKENFDHLDVCFTRSNRGNNLLTINGKPFTLNRRIKDACYWECVKLRCKYIKYDPRLARSNSSGGYRLVANRRGGQNLLYNGHMYTVERKYLTTINWVCAKNGNVKLRCPARCVTNSNRSIKLTARRRGICIKGRPGCLLIDGYRFVISYQQRHRCYLKCSNFRSQCRARAIQNKLTGQLQLRNASTPPVNLAQYVRSSRGTDLVFFEGNTYTPNEKLREGQKSRDWKCSMYHKAKCRARLNTRITDLGDLIHMTSQKHTHTPMYLLQQEGTAGDMRKLSLTRNLQCDGLRTAKGN
ncbi:hypothetical protein AWZ03_008938 [Drosophila navojoa]|uniref:FLYWCH-type domain-containing protein n=1 Tax=Drosophila navojoa TaxID=7232 RepID=A0A484B6X7_DRONA|nr:hypothetical protein AWZ03_008938 [Drosophila navojoa]